MNDRKGTVARARPQPRKVDDLAYKDSIDVINEPPVLEPVQDFEIQDDIPLSAIRQHSRQLHTPFHSMKDDQSFRIVCGDKKPESVRQMILSKARRLGFSGQFVTRIRWEDEQGQELSYRQGALVVRCWRVEGNPK